MIFPWPGSRERKAAVAAARQQKEHSLASAEHAAAVESQIRHLAGENHFADAITDQIISTYRARRGH